MYNDKLKNDFDKIFDTLFIYHICGITNPKSKATLSIKCGDDLLNSIDT